jgi:DNA mismatch endonuclease, patch repair protein
MDVYDKNTRSRIMSSIKPKYNKSTEGQLIRILKRQKIYGWRRHLPISGTPDFAWPKLKLAIFVDGCFWHGCPLCNRRVKSNKRFWNSKIERNRRRDRRVDRYLRIDGWSVLRVRECRISKKATISRIVRKLKEKGGWEYSLKVNSEKATNTNTKSNLRNRLIARAYGN